MPDPSLPKQSLRKTLLAERERLSADLRAAHSATIVGRLTQLPGYRQVGAVLGYMNFGSEFESDAFAVRALADGKRLALPRVNHHTNHLDLYWVEDFEEQLAQGAWGIREPIVERCARVSGADEVEFALLPGVAFTRDGARLGYGGGFYDKLLATARPPLLVAAAFSLQLVEQLPQEPTDVRVGWIVTETETIACRQSEHEEH